MAVDHQQLATADQAAILDPHWEVALDKSCCNKRVTSVPAALHVAFGSVKQSLADHDQTGREDEHAEAGRKVRPVSSRR
jgi:hypothetical protein